MPVGIFGAARAAGGGLRIADRFASAWVRRKSGRGDLRNARHLLGLDEPTAHSFQVAAHHLIYNVGDPHPDDRAAFASLLQRAVSPSIEPQDVAVLAAVECQLADGHVLVGSPEADPLSQAIFGYRSAGDFGSEYIGGTIDLPFRRRS